MLWAWLGGIDTLLVTAFGVSVWQSARWESNRAVQDIGGLILARAVRASSGARCAV